MLLERLGLGQINGYISGFLAFALTIFVSYISYYGFEIKFLKLKANFTHIDSGEAVRKE